MLLHISQAFCLETSGDYKFESLSIFVVPMSFQRAPSATSLASRAWSTAELGEGLAEILTTGAFELPDDLSKIKDVHGLPCPWACCQCGHHMFDTIAIGDPVLMVIMYCQAVSNHG